MENRGGKRVGSGRKKSEPTKLKTFHISFEIDNIIYSETIIANSKSEAHKLISDKAKKYGYWFEKNNRGGKRVGSGAPKKRETTTKTFRFPLDKYDEIVERIKAIIFFYNNA